MAGCKKQKQQKQNKTENKNKTTEEKKKKKKKTKRGSEREGDPTSGACEGHTLPMKGLSPAGSTRAVESAADVKWFYC